MSGINYYLFQTPDKERRVYHGPSDAAVRAASRLQHQLDCNGLEITPTVIVAFQSLEQSGEAEMAAIAQEGRTKHGWLTGEALYAALCGAAIEYFGDFEPECPDEWEPEFWGWRWQHVGISDDLADRTCERIAELVLRPDKRVEEYIRSQGLAAY